MFKLQCLKYYVKIQNSQFGDIKKTTKNPDSGFVEIQWFSSTIWYGPYSYANSCQSQSVMLRDACRAATALVVHPMKDAKDIRRGIA